MVQMMRHQELICMGTALRTLFARNYIATLITSKRMAFLEKSTKSFVKRLWAFRAAIQQTSQLDSKIMCFKPD
jgi:hypothetical protein